MPTGTCRLCGKTAELQLSHVIPAFIFRWKRDTSGSGYLRASMAPNKRVQDGIKRHWLCAACEERFNRSETKFATALFYPYSRGSGTRFRYGPWLMHFGISVVWRILTFFKEENAALVDQTASPSEEAERYWRDFLLGNRPHPGKFELHMLPFDALASATAPGLPQNMNRYLMRAVEMDLAHGGTIAFVYAKLGRFAFLGFTRLDHPKQWVGTKVHAMEGLIEPRKYTLPMEFGDYLSARARRMAGINAKISPRQRERIDTDFRANIDKLAGSDFHRAMQEDVRLFGRIAFDQKKISGESDS